MLLEQRSHTKTQSQRQSQLNLDYDLAIVGGGIVGATLACGLKNSNLRVVLIEPQAKTVAASRRQAYALTLQTGRILQAMGVWDEILPKITTFRQISLSDSDHPSVVHFKPQDLGTEALGYVGEHSVILTAMHDFLDSCENVSWLCPAQVVKVNYQPDFAEIELEAEGKTQTLRTQLVIAADGSRSPLRQAAGISTYGWKYWQSCIAMTIKTEKIGRAHV